MRVVGVSLECRVRVAPQRRIGGLCADVCYDHVHMSYRNEKRRRDANSLLQTEAPCLDAANPQRGR